MDWAGELVVVGDFSVDCFLDKFVLSSYVYQNLENTHFKDM